MTEQSLCPCFLPCRLLAAIAAFLSVGLLAAAEVEKPKPLRYLRPEKNKFVLESEITETRNQDGAIYVSLTDRGREKMTLTLRFDNDRHLKSAEAVQEAGESKHRALLTLKGTNAKLSKIKGIVEFQVAADPIVTTAPDWSDIFQLVRRYDGKKGGRQEFTGLWIHPVRDHLVLKFRIERVGETVIRAAGRKIALNEYRIRLRSGDYLAWADADRRVYKLFPAGQPKAVQLDDSSVGAQDAAQTAESGRLAGPVLAEQDQDLALGHLEVDIRHRMGGAEALEEARDADHGRRIFRARRGRPV